MDDAQGDYGLSLLAFEPREAPNRHKIQRESVQSELSITESNSNSDRDQDTIDELPSPTAERKELIKRVGSRNGSLFNQRNDSDAHKESLKEQVAQGTEMVKLSFTDVNFRVTVTAT